MEARANNTIVIIPSYNESRTIGDIVRNIVNMHMSVLVIDDGSIDNTERVALDNGGMVIRHKHNLGKGSSLRQGIKYVLDKTKFKWIIMMDGDGQHHTEDIKKLMDATKAKGLDLIIGNRMHETKDMPSARYWTNKFTSWVVSKLCGQLIPDTQCGFRLVRVESLRKLHLMSDKYDIESEILLLAAEKAMEIRSVPIQTIYGEEVSAINPIRDTFRFFRLVSKHHFKRARMRKAHSAE